MSLTIKELSQKLAEVTEFDDPMLLDAASDKRKGAINLVEKTQKRIKRAMIQKVAFKSRFVLENELHSEGYKILAGVDEVGRGPLAGPVVACAIILPDDFDVVEVNDSKQLSKETRERIFSLIEEQAVSIGIGIADNKLIDEINIYEATRVAMKEAVENLDILPNFLFVDAMEIDVNVEQEKIIKGDAKSNSIAAASIVAKHYRDKLMDEMSLKYPEYGFDDNAGYGTKRHLDALKKFGPSPIHRATFSPVTKLIEEN